MILLIFAIQIITVGCQKPPIQRAIGLMNQGRWEEAVDLLRPEIESNPADPDLNEVYGTALLRNGQPSLAVWPLRRSYLAEGDRSDSGAMLAEALVTGGASQEGLDLVTELIQAEPDNIYLLSLRARAYSAILDYEEALADTERLIELSPQNPRFLEQRINVLIDLDRTAEASDAVAALRDYLEGDEGDFATNTKARFCGAEARFMSKYGEQDEAQAMFEACLVKYPAEADLLMPMVEMLIESGQAERASEVIEEQASSKLGQPRLRLQVLWALDLESHGEMERAEQVLRGAAERMDAPQPWLELADYYLRVDDMAATADALGHAIRLQLAGEDEENFDYGLIPQEGLFQYADILIQTGDFDRVRRLMKSIEEPTFVLLLQARLKLVEGDARGALADYEEAFRSWSSNAGARYLAAEAALQIGEFDVAMNHYMDSLRADADASDSGLILARLQVYQRLPRAAYDTLYYYLRNVTDKERARDILHMLSQLSLELGSLPSIEYVRDEMLKMDDPSSRGMAVADYAHGLNALQGAEAALAYLESVESLDAPENAQALLFWSRLTRAQGDAESSRDRIEAALRGAPESVELKITLGEFYLDSPETEEQGGALLLEAAEAAPDLPRAQGSLANYLSRTAETEALVNALDASARLDPTDPVYGFDAAKTLLDAGQKEEAIVRLGEHAEKFPWYGDTATQLARVDLEEGEFGSRTLMRARLGSEFGFEDPSFSWEVLGRVRMARGEMSEAELALIEAVRFGPMRPEPHYYLGTVFEERDRTDRARLAYERALEMGEFDEAGLARQRLDALGPAPENLNEEEVTQ